ncbi:MAG TPA: YdbL family protein [Sphingomonadaceae bacterium]|nr:YdbL family protein [Sphingomonadaceae bacterium]
MVAAAVGAAAFASSAVVAQGDESATLRASGAVGEQADGYLGVVDSAPSSVRDQVNAINIKRRAFYTEIARTRGATVQEVAVATACGLFKNKVQPGQFYRLPDGVWRKREGAVELPAYCS